MVGLSYKVLFFGTTQAAELHQFLLYSKVWEKIAVVNGLLLRGKRIIITGSDTGEDGSILQQMCIELAHKGHTSGTCTKQLL